MDISIRRVRVTVNRAMLLAKPVRIQRMTALLACKINYCANVSDRNKFQHSPSIFKINFNFFFGAAKDKSSKRKKLFQITKMLQCSYQKQLIFKKKPKIQSLTTSSTLTSNHPNLKCEQGT